MSTENQNQIISLNYHIMGQTGEHKTARDTTVRIKMEDGDYLKQWSADIVKDGRVSLKDIEENWFSCLAQDSIGTPQEVFNRITTEVAFIALKTQNPDIDGKEIASGLRTLVDNFRKTLD